jgi:hypothetical protein
MAEAVAVLAAHGLPQAGSFHRRTMSIATGEAPIAIPPYNEDLRAAIRAYDYAMKSGALKPDALRSDARKNGVPKHAIHAVRRPPAAAPFGAEHRAPGRGWPHGPVPAIKSLFSPLK